VFDAVIAVLFSVTTVKRESNIFKLGVFLVGFDITKIDIGVIVAHFGVLSLELCIYVFVFCVFVFLVEVIAVVFGVIAVDFGVTTVEIDANVVEITDKLLIWVLLVLTLV